MRTRTPSHSARLAACLLVSCAAFVVAGCAVSLPGVMSSQRTPEEVRPGTIPSPPAIDARVEERILALDPQHITEHDVNATLALGPTPQTILLHGGVYGTNLIMMSFAKFLVAMGYPDSKIRDPSDGSYSQDPFGSSKRLAGEIAWYYEHDGVRPMMVGHSQGGIQAVKVLYELNGAFTDKLNVWNPVTDSREERYMIADPLTGAQRFVVGVSVAYVSVVGAGGVALVVPTDWDMAQRLHTIPNTVDDFTGFSIDYDPIALTFPGPASANRFRPNFTADVRNVTLPRTYSHLFVPETEPLASDTKMRDWLNAYIPGTANGQPPGADDGRANNALWAADVWFSIKKHWCIEAQRLIRARRAALAVE